MGTRELAPVFSTPSAAALISSGELQLDLARAPAHRADDDPDVVA